MEHLQTRWNGWGVPGHDDPLAVNEPAWRWLAEAFGMPALLATPPRELSGIVLPPSRLSDKTREKLAALLGSLGVQQDDFARARHAAGRSLIDLLRLRAGDLSTAPDAVLYPRSEADVLKVLKFCAEMDIAVFAFGGGAGTATPLRGRHAAIVALNLSELNRIVAVDTISGLAEVQAGIGGPALERQLAARGMTLGHRPEAFEFSSLGGWIAAPDMGQEAARYGEVSRWLRGLKVATPQGLLTCGNDLKSLLLGSQGSLGVITSATIRIRGRVPEEDHRRYLFPDFASGLAAMREAWRIELPHNFLHLSDDGETRFLEALEQAGQDRDLIQHLFQAYLSVRRFNSGAARLVAGFAGNSNDVKAARQTFDSLARRLGALRLGPDDRWREQRFAFGYRRDTLLDRGVGVDRLAVEASWAKLPSLYMAVRRALRQAMQTHAPRTGAHGQVLCQVSAARPESAMLTFTWVYPRILEDGIAQAQAIRSAALAAAGKPQKEELARDVLRGIKRVLDPTAILNPGVI